MKRLVLAMAVLALGASVAFAGPNDGIVLTPHADQTGQLTNGDPCANLPIPPTCEETIPGNAAPHPEEFNTEWFVVLAARAGGAAINTVVFGLGAYDSGACYIGYHGPCSPELSPLYVPSGADWPGPNTGVAISWSPNCLSGDLVPVAYFGVYGYAPGDIPLGDFHPTQAAVVVSCDDPPEEDPIADFGAMGCGGADGLQVCPGPGVGACCLPDGECILVTEQECLDAGYVWVGGPCDPNPCIPEGGACCVDQNGDGNPETCIDVLNFDECEALGGQYQGDGTVCGPNNEPCPPDEPPNATKSTTWGQIKSVYR